MKSSLLYWHICMVFLIFLYSCQPRDGEEVIDLNSPISPSVHDFFTDINVVQLETNEDILIGGVSRVVYYNKRFYILDVLSQQFLCFDEQGKFVYKISARGRGPDEYNYITDFTIDQQGKRIFILDPVVQRVLLYDLDGNHVETFSVLTENGAAFRQIFALNDSIILLASATNHQLVYFNLNQNGVIQKEFKFPIEGTLKTFYPRNNVYQLHGRTFVLPYLSREVYDITEIKPVVKFNWDFGAANNSKNQIEKLIEKIASRQYKMTFFHDDVGKGKILNHHIVRVFETPRYKIAILEYDNHFRHIFRDKKTSENYVFNHFKEDIGLMYFNIQSDVAIGWDTGIPERNNRIAERSHRRFSFYHKEILNQEDRQIIENHNPMNDNPFFVVYRFKE